MRLIVTRPAAQAGRVVAELRTLGVDTLALPLIDIAPAADARPLLRAWQELHAMALVMFVSANAVQHFMHHRPPGLLWPAATLAGATGPGTSAALRAFGVPLSALVEPAGGVFDSEALWLQLQGRDWQGRRVCVVRGEGGRDWLAEQLGARGAAVAFVAAYRRGLPLLDAAARGVLAEALASPRQHLWSFSSSQAVAHLDQLAPSADWSAAAALATHARIAAALRRLGFGSVRLTAADVASLRDAVRDELRDTRSIQSRPP
jgi:uroporphyrinogen-III synthase